MRGFILQSQSREEYRANHFDYEWKASQNSSVISWLSRMSKYKAEATLRYYFYTWTSFDTLLKQRRKVCGIYKNKKSSAT